MSAPWTPSVELHLRIRVAEHRREELLAFLREAIPVYEAPGGIRVSLQQEHGDPERYIERVEYRSEADFADDQERVERDPISRALVARWREILLEPPVVEVYRPVSLA